MEYTSEHLSFDPPPASPSPPKSNMLATTYVPPLIRGDDMIYHEILGKSREPFTLDTPQGTLTLAPAHPIGLASGNVPFAGMRFTISGDMFTMWVPAGALSALLYRTDPDVALSQIAPVTRGLVFESLFEELFEEIERGGVSMHIDEIADPMRNPPGIIGLKITLADLPPFVGLIDAPKAIADRFLNWIAQIPEQRRPLSNLPVIARVIAGPYLAAVPRPVILASRRRHCL